MSIYRNECTMLIVVSILSMISVPAYVVHKSTILRPKSTYSHILMSTTQSLTDLASSGVAIGLDGVCLSVGNNDIMTDISWSILPFERWALVGENGAGKSTLLRALTGTGGLNVAIREGNVVIAKKSRVGYLEQKGVSGSTQTVREEVTSRMDRFKQAEKALAEAEKRVSDGDCSDEALTALTDCTTEFDSAGGYVIEQKISNVLKGLGFLPEDYEKRCSEFSGGWQMRIALARLLLSEPDLLILDEPTNHLDKGAKDWLGGYLSAYSGTLLLVSHDTNILRTAVSSIAEVRHGRIELYKSRSYDQWLIERDERVKVAQAAFEANQKEIARLQSFVDRFGAKTMGASMAQSRLKTIEKLENNGPQAPVLGNGPVAALKLPTPPRGSKLLMALKKVTLKWPVKESDSETSSLPVDRPPIISNCDITIERGMRIVVRGPNGAGKSTLISALAGSLSPASGARELGDGLSLGVFTQDLAQDLDQEALAVDVVTRMVRVTDPSLSDERARNVLGTLGLTGEKAVRKVGHLSGGEKARVALASFVLTPHNLLLLDEPSNHLDQTTLKVLTAALRKFEGAIVVISHDKEFLTQLEPTHVVLVRGGTVRVEERGLRESDWEDTLDWRKACSSSEDKYAPVSVTQTKFGSVSSVPKILSDEDRKKILNAPRRIVKIEASLEQLERTMGEIDEEMITNGRDRGKLVKLQEKKDEVQGKIDKFYAEYDELVQLTAQ